VFSRNAAIEGKAIYNFDIFTMNSDGSDVRQITNDPEFDAEPMWSPDGKRIFFISGREGDFAVFSMDENGGHLVNLTNSSGSEGPVGFSGDGTRIILFGSTPDQPSIRQLWITDLEGHGRRQISSFKEKIYRVDFSPDKKRYAFSGKREGNFEIYVSDAMNLPEN